MTVNDNPHIEEVIIAYDTRGSGKTTDDPIRRVLQVFSKDGKLLAENDPQNSRPYYNKTIADHTKEIDQFRTI